MTTADDGGFVFESLTPGIYALEAEAKGFAAGFQSRVVCTPETADRVIRIELGQGAALNGTVTNADGLGVPGASVTLLWPFADGVGLGERRLQTVADANGCFAFQDLPPGRARAAVRASGYPLLAVDVTVGIDARLDIVLPGRAAVAGRVTTGRSEPISGAEIMITFTGSEVTSSTIGLATTDENGEYRLDHLPAAKIDEISVQKAGYPTWPKGSPFEDHGRRMLWPQLRAGETLRADVTMQSGATVVGRILDAATSLPIVGVEVRARPLSAEGSRSTVTDESGSYRLEGLEPGDHCLSARAAGYAPWGRDHDCRSHAPLDSDLLAEALLQVEQGEGVEIRREILLSRGGRIAGRVVTSAGKPISSARVSATWGGSEVATGSVLSGPDGRFALGHVPRGEAVILHVEAAGFCTGAAEVVASSSGPEVEDVEIRLQAGAAVGGLVYGADARPLAGAVVTALDPRYRHVLLGPIDDCDLICPPGDLSCPVSAHKITDPHGRFRIDGVTPGSLCLRVEAPRHLTKRVGVLRLREGLTVPDIEIHLQAAHILAGEVRDEEGRPVAGARVDASVDTEDHRSYVGLETTDTDGRFTIDALAPNDIELWVSKDGYVTESWSGLRPGATGVAVVLRRGLEISGRIIQPDTLPAAGVWVEVEDHGSAMADLNGEFVITELAAGHYALGARDFENGEYRQASLKGVEAGATNVLLALRVGGTSAGIVVDEAGIPIAGAEVAVCDVEDATRWQNRLSMMVMTDDGGRFAIRGLDVSGYYIRVYKRGYQRAESSIGISGSMKATVVLARADE